MPNLYIVATPIGNLDDITKRALDILNSADFILCEDTRVTQKLLNHYNINKPLISYHQHSKFQKIDYIFGLLGQNKNLALVSDAGTPGISDPGNYLISRALNEFGDNLKVIPIPGPSALVAALSISGFDCDRFVFFGFPPHKKGRNKFFQEIVNSNYPVAFYESTHRILKTLDELKEKFQVSSKQSKLATGQASFGFQVVVCRELTKKFESVYRGDIIKIINEIVSKKENQKGEFVIIIQKLKSKNQN